MHSTTNTGQNPTAGTESRSSIPVSSAAIDHRPEAEPDVGLVLRRMDAGRQLSSEELEQHIKDTCLLMERAYARFLEHGNPANREESLLWMHRQHEAIRSRSPEVKAAMEAASLRRVEDAAAYFLEQADRDRAALARRRG